MIAGGYRQLTRALGVLPGRWNPTPRAEGRWDLVVHGASAGEVRAASCWIESFQSQSPKLRILRTCSTATGIAAGAQARLPRDVPQAVTTFLERCRPRALVLTEADLWPNLLAGADARGIPIGVIGARMSEKAARRYGMVSGPARTLLGHVDAWATASEEDATRLIELGVDPGRVRTTGWLKWPQSPEASEPFDPGAVSYSPHRRHLPLLVLGSAHPGEVALLAERLADTVLDPQRSRWLVVARHRRAVQALTRECQRTLPEDSWALEDRFGVLDGWYRAADAAFVGGGARGRGVHDLLAPLQAGHRPLCFLDRGDPGAVGRTLAPEGFVLSVDRPRPPEDIGAALEDISHRWTDLLERFDGRNATTAFLVERGVLDS